MLTKLIIYLLRCPRQVAAYKSYKADCLSHYNFFFLIKPLLWLILENDQKSSLEFTLLFTVWREGKHWLRNAIVVIIGRADSSLCLIPLE